MREIDGKVYVLEHPLKADFALIRAHKADGFGNCVFWRTARNFSPLMATAARVCVVEAEAILTNGELDPDAVHLPGVFVQRLVHVPEHEDPFEYKINRPRPIANTAGGAR